MKNYIQKVDFKNYLEQNITAIVFSFFVGVAISFIPFFNILIETNRSERIFQLEREIAIKKIQDKCQDLDSEYKKLFYLGFPESALVKFNQCVKEKSMGL